MANTPYRVRRLLIVLYLVALHLALSYFVFRDVSREPEPDQIFTGVGDPTLPALPPSPLPIPSVVVDLDPVDHESGELELAIPVAGVKPEEIADSFKDPRTRSDHDAIDIPAAEGTPVLAATDGVIARFFESVAGGTTIYQFTSDEKYVLYYAHLQHRAEGIKPGDFVVRGQTIGYVGDTGNAGPGNFHLHFSVSRVTDPARYWEGEYINPYPLLKKSRNR